MALTEEERKVRNANKAKNLILQADHAGASSNLNSMKGLNATRKQNIGSADGLVKTPS